MTEIVKIKSERFECGKQKIRNRMQELAAKRDETKLEFVERFMSNDRSGENTIEWNADDVVIAETKGYLADAVLNLTALEDNPMDIFDAYERVCNRVKEEILDSCRYRGASRSSNVYANINEDVVRQAKAQFIEEFNWEYDRLLEIRGNLQKTEENEDIAKVIVDLARRTHSQLRRCNNDADNFTVKTKQRIAINKAEAYGDVFNSMLAVADRYGVRHLVEKELEERDQY